MISAIGNDGSLRFQLFEGNFNQFAGAATHHQAVFHSSVDGLRGVTHLPAGVNTYRRGSVPPGLNRSLEERSCLTALSGKYRLLGGRCCPPTM